jgi:hypothetical protein
MASRKSYSMGRLSAGIGHAICCVFGPLAFVIGIFGIAARDHEMGGPFLLAGLGMFTVGGGIFAAILAIFDQADSTKRQEQLMREQAQWWKARSAKREADKTEQAKQE